MVHVFSIYLFNKTSLQFKPKMRTFGLNYDKIYSICLSFWTDYENVDLYDIHDVVVADR